MRNLKKILALVLALVMSLSLVTMANAVEFSDAADIDYTEAVDVMVAIGVLEGADGKFNPKDILTREQAAKIVTYMLLGKAAADKLVTEDAPFTDVAATRWSAGAIAYCAEKGILAGNGDGTFNPTGKLTGHAFAKMLLVALGYDAKAEGYAGTGNTWSINVAADAVAAGIDVEDVALDLDVTREQAAQMAFQTLSANLVEYDDKGTEITLSDGTKVVIGASDPETYTNASVSVANRLGDADGLMQFAEKYFSKLFLNTTGANGVDSFGRPAQTWYYGTNNKSDDKVGTYGTEAADYTIVVDEATTLGALLADEELELNPHAAPNAANYDGGYYANGVSAYQTAIVNNTDDALAVGQVVELFLNDEGKVDNVVTCAYSLVKITKVAKAAEDADYDYLVSIADLDGVSNAASYKDTKIAGFDADKFAKDDVVVVVKKAGTDLLSIAAADSVTGKMTAKGTDYVKVDGVEYPIAYSFAAGTDFTNEFTYYLDPNGYVMGSEQVTDAREAVNYLYLADIEIYGAKNDTIKDSKDPYGIAKVVLMDGSEKVIDLYVKKWTNSADMTPADGEGTAQNIQKDDWYYAGVDGKYYEINGSIVNGAEDGTAVGTFTTGSFYAYEIKDNMYVLNDATTLNADTDVDTTIAEAVTAADTLTVTEGKAAVTGTISGTANSKTVLTVIEDGKAEVFTGIAAFETTTFTVGSASGEVDGILVETDDDTGIITNIFVVGGSVSVVEANWAYLVEAGDTTADGTYYKFYEDGKEVSYISSVTTAGLHDITLTDGEVTGSSTANVSYGTVDLVDDTYFTVANGGTYYFDEDCKIYNISGDFTGEETSIAKGDVVAIGWYNDGDDYAAVIYVIDAPEVEAVKADSTAVDFVQVGTDITVSGTLGTNLVVDFGAGDVTIGLFTSAVNGNIEYVDAKGITLTFNVASMTP